MQHRLDHATETHTFRGSSMQDAVGKLKASLGPDAVIIATRRGRDPHGRFVEITAVGAPRVAQPARQPAPQFTPQRSAQPEIPPPAMGGRRGASAAYARAARLPSAPLATQRAALPPLLAALRGEAPAEKPFAERAAWLARQIEERTADHQAAEARAAALAHRPPYHLVADDTTGDPSPAPHGDTEQLEGKIARLEALVAALSAGHAPAGEGTHPPSPASPAPAVSRAPAAPPAPPAATAAATVVPPTQFDEAAIAATLAGLRGDLMALAAEQTPLRDELAGIRALMETTEREAQAVRALRLRLIETGISAEHARDLATRALDAIPGTADDGDVLAYVGRAIADGIACGGADFDQRRVLAFVGPTGVGKTTTVAKVAVHARLAGKRVALVTVDTFRMAAVEQLARYAEVLDAPLRVVKSPEALPAALAELADYDLVLVDTTGRNPRASEQVRTLARFFPAGWGGELVLTVAASTRERDLFATVDAFARLGYARLCITKTDETDALGMLYTVARRAARPLCWITDGQQVPDDIEAADPAVIATRILAAGARPTLAMSA